MRWITTQRLQDEFALPRVLAREIFVEQWQAAVRYRWQPWVWLACCVLAALVCWFGWLPWNPGVRDDSAAVWLAVIAGWGWIGIGRWLAEPAILVSAAARARRLRHAGDASAPHACAADTTTASSVSPSAGESQP